MVFNVSDFKSQISKGKFDGVAFSSRFAVRIYPPSKFLNGNSPSPEELSMFCYSSNIPGRNLSTIDYKRHAYGDIIAVPTGGNFDPLMTTFYGDTNYQVLNFFQQWIDFIAEGGDTQASDKMTSGRAWREIAYKEDYQSTIELIGFNVAGSQTVKYKFYNAFPVTLADATLGWETNNEIIRIPVQFRYDYHTIEISGVTTPVHFKSSIGLFTRLAQIASIAGVINSVQRPRNLQDLINLGTTVRTTSRGLGLI